MILRLATMRQRLLHFSQREDGNSSIEFLFFVIPLFLFLLSGIEAGILSTRQVMLERGVDLTVRQIRIGNIKEPEIDQLKLTICGYAGIIPDCLDNIQIKMVKMDVRNWSNALNGPVQCIDRSEEVQAPATFTNGGNNELMVLQVCALFDPFFPTSGLGQHTLSNDLEDSPGMGYALVATTSFVMEPFQ